MQSRTPAFVVSLVLVLASSVSAQGMRDDARTQEYLEFVDSLEKRRVASKTERNDQTVVADIIAAFESTTNRWLGTKWGRGNPQTDLPGQGKINCGTFVGTVLEDVGFRINVKKLQRQPSQLIIESFVSGKRIRKFSNASMKTFIASVREMGTGLFIIGLDMHVGFLLQTEDDLRFIHSRVETESVVNEPAATANFIEWSRYRVVGKLLSKSNLRDWRLGREISVKGNW